MKHIAKAQEVGVSRPPPQMASAIEFERPVSMFAKRKTGPGKAPAASSRTLAGAFTGMVRETILQISNEDISSSADQATYGAFASLRDRG
jgi:hypothetical protein